MSTKGQLFTTPVNGGWAHLSVPTGRHFGLNQVSADTWVWHSALTLVSNASFPVLPIFAGTVFCEPRPGFLHFDRSNRELLHMREISRTFLQNLRTRGPAWLRFLPTPKEKGDHAQYLAAIENPAISTATVKLVLRPHSDPPIALQGALGHLSYVLYDSVEIGSLYESLSSLQDWPLYEAGRALVDALGATHDEIFKLFLMGLLEVPVQPGTTTLGSAGPQPGAAARLLEVKAFTNLGPVDPVLALWSMREQGLLEDSGFLSSSVVQEDFVWDDRSTKDNRLDPGSTISRQYFEDDLTGRFLYPFSILKSLSARWNLSGPAWRLVGDQQKNLYKSKLATPSTEAILTFFDWDDRHNVFQLEAAVELFCKNASGASLQVDMLGSSPLGEGSESPSSDIYLLQVDPMYALGGPRVGASIATGRSGIRAYDEHDGCVFLVAGGVVRWIGYGFSSFTSGRNANEDEAASSIEGNRKYLLRSRTSPGNRGHNYCFIVTREESLGGVAHLPGWFFWGSETPSRETGEPDPNGKGYILIHRGNTAVDRRGDVRQSSWNFSTGCQVALRETFYEFRTALCEVSLERGFDEGISAICKGRPADAELLWRPHRDHRNLEELAVAEPSRVYGPGASTETAAISSDSLRSAVAAETGERVRLLAVLPARYWDGKIRGTYMLLRPFEGETTSGGGQRRQVNTPSPFEE